MKRRNFLRLSPSVLFLTPFRAFSYNGEQSHRSIENAYSLWYNRPAIAVNNDGFFIGYVTSSGEVKISYFSKNLEKQENFSIYKYNLSPSDHGSPSIIRVGSGLYKDHLLACFSNHSSELFCARSRYPDSAKEFEDIKVIDRGRCTYVSLAEVRDNKILLMYTRQLRTGKNDSSEWRQTICIESTDGGSTWSSERVINSFGEGTFPYATPMVVGNDGYGVVAYSTYYSSSKRHIGLTLITGIGGGDIAKTTIIEPENAFGSDVIPYCCTVTSSGHIMISYSQVNHTGLALGKVVKFDLKKRVIISIEPITVLATHAYPGGMAFLNDGEEVIFSSPNGGLSRINLLNGSRVSIQDAGKFSSPSVFTANNKQYIFCLENPIIKSTREFKSNIFIRQLEM